MKNGVILSKVSSMESYLLKLKGYIPVDLESFRNDWGVQKIAERSLQVLIEGMIDIAGRIIARSGGTPPPTSAEAIERLGLMGILTDTEKYVKMVRFRNLIVHNYEAIDPEILYVILTGKLSDFYDFISEIKKHENI